MCVTGMDQANCLLCLKTRYGRLTPLALTYHGLFKSWQGTLTQAASCRGTTVTASFPQLVELTCPQVRHVSCLSIDRKVVIPSSTFQHTDEQPCQLLCYILHGTTVLTICHGLVCQPAVLTTIDSVIILMSSHITTDG